MKRRNAISTAQKASLRAQRALNPKLSNIQLRNWFIQTYNQSIALSSVSEILSSRYNFLDSKTTHPRDLRDVKKRRQTDWPKLEEALFEWIQEAQTQIPITGEVIREKARQFWTKLPTYKGLKMPVFSNGWLTAFQSRKAIRSNILHGEAASVDEQAAA
ncbi:hypothetical protein DTO212C5_1103 [Paecilomyces variotii]|nr:hypothetical protein DTO212C5_1103 [Paecilomyces variotii]